MPYRCCACCAKDPSYHADNPPDSHDTTCGYMRPCPDGGRGDQWRGRELITTEEGHER